MSLKDILQKLRVVDLQNEIRKVLTEFKGYKKFKKFELIEIMLDNESLFKHLEKLDTTEFKKANVPKPKGKIQKARAEDKPQKEKLKKEPTDYVKFVKQYRMDNNLSLKDAMKEIKEKGLYTAKSPAKPKKKLSKDEENERAEKLSRSRIRKKLVEYEKTVTDDPATRDKTQFLKLKKIIGKKTAVQKKKRLMLREKLPKLYNKLKELNFFEDLDIEKEESKQIKKKEEKIDPNDFSYLGITNEEAEELLGIKKEKKEKTKQPKKEEPKTPAKKQSKKEEPKKEEPKKKEDVNSLSNLKKKLKELTDLIDDLEITINSFPKKLDKEQDKDRTKLVNKRAKLIDNEKKLKLEIRDKEDQGEVDDDKLDEFKKLVNKFIKKPSKKLYEDINVDYDMAEDLPEKLFDKLEQAMDKYEEGLKKPAPKKKQVNKKTEEPKNKEQEKTTNEVIQLIDNYNKLNKKYQEYAKLAYKKTYDGFKDIDFDRKDNEISKFEKLIKEGKLTEKEIIDKVMTKQYSNTYGQRLPLSWFYNTTLMTVVMRTNNFLAEEFNKMEKTLKDLLYYNKPSQGLRISLATDGSTVANPNTLKDVEQNKEKILNDLQKEENKFETQLDRVREVENFKKDIIENFNFYNTKVTYNKTKIPGRVSKAFDKYREIKDNSEEILDKYIEKYKKGKLFKKQSKK